MKFSKNLLDGCIIETVLLDRARCQSILHSVSNWTNFRNLQAWFRSQYHLLFHCHIPLAINSLILITLSSLLSKPSKQTPIATTDCIRFHRPAMCCVGKKLPSVFFLDITAFTIVLITCFV